MFSPDIGGATPGALHGAACCLQHNSHITETEIHFTLVSCMYTFIYLLTYSVTNCTLTKTRQSFSKHKFITNVFPAQHSYAIQVQQCEILPSDWHNTHPAVANLEVLMAVWLRTQLFWHMTSCHWVLFPVF